MDKRCRIKTEARIRQLKDGSLQLSLYISKYDRNKLCLDTGNNPVTILSKLKIYNK